MLRSYRKELVSNRFIVNGTPVPFEVLGGNRGVITLDDAKEPALVKALDVAAAAKQKGIVRITEAEVAELKKKWPYNPSQSRSRKELLRPAFQRKPQLAKPAAAGAVAGANAKPAIPLIPGVTAPANAASVPAPLIPGATPPANTPAFRPATRRIRRSPAPLDQPPPVTPSP